LRGSSKVATAPERVFTIACMRTGWERLPLSVKAFAVLQAAEIPYVLATDSKARRHLLLIAAVFLLLGLVTAAVVVWAQRWAWGLFVIFAVVGLVQGPQGKGAGPVLINLATVALALSPGMLRHLGYKGRTPGRKGPEKGPEPA
jgi:MFS family permease